MRFCQIKMAEMQGAQAPPPDSTFYFFVALGVACLIFGTGCLLFYFPQQWCHDLGSVCFIGGNLACCILVAWNLRTIWNATFNSECDTKSKQMDTNEAQIA